MKKTTLPKKPVTKRDKHFYDMGAEQQAKVFDKWEQWSRKSLGDYQEPITNNDYIWQIVAVIVFVGIILLAHPYTMSALN